MTASFDPVAYINEPRWRHSSLGLDRITLLLAKLGNPQNAFKAIHVAGTNGKGSTCAYLAEILQASGARTALFTSPYIERFEERIRVNGEDISSEELLEATLEVKQAAEEVERELCEHPTEFELMCAVAFVHFAKAGVDWAVVEVGLGGRLDATNVIVPDLSVITRIGLDHTDILGDTIAKIAVEKAGIIKPGVPVVSWPQDPEAMEVIKQRCENLSCELTISDFDLLAYDEVACDEVACGEVACGSDTPERSAGYDHGDPMQSFAYRGASYKTRLLGAYQPYNAAVAIDAALELGIQQAALTEGICDAKWPGRFEMVARHPLVIVDGSHNPQGAEALAQSLARITSNVTFVMGVLADKDYPRIIEPILPYAKRFITYTPDNPRALSADKLAEEISKQAQSVEGDIEVEVADSPCKAIVQAIKKESPEGVIVAFGTLYSIGEIKRAIRDLTTP